MGSRTKPAIWVLTILLMGAAWASALALQAAEPKEAAFDCAEVGGVDYLLLEPTVLLLGEVHGTVESPHFVADLLCNVVASGHTAAVALQLPEFEGEVLTRYLESDGSKADRESLLTEARELTLYKDARFSEAMVGLVESIRALRARGGEIEVRLFVPPEIDSETRQKLLKAERPMAVRLWEDIRQVEVDLFIVLAGLTHSRVIRGSELDANHEPMGHILSQWNPEHRLLSLALSHSGGTAWICTSRHEVDCRAVSVSGGGWGDPNSIYIYGDVAETGYHGVYYVGRISHSPPARPGMVEPEYTEQPVTELPFEPTPDF